MIKWLFVFCSIILLNVQCSNKINKEYTHPIFKQKNDCGIDFVNKVTGSKDFNIFNYRNFYNGGGCAIGDLNNDGLADAYFTANQGSNKLYLNKGNFTFQDITAASNTADNSSWSTGVALVDINADGWLDIYVCNAGFINGKAPKSRMYINNHDLSFTDKAAEYNLENTGGYATHAAFFDYDNDGDLDCFIVNNSFIPTNTLNYENKRNLRAKDWPVKDFLKGGGDRLLKNNQGHFEDVSEKAGIYGSLISFGLGVTVGDVNGDGWLDVYVSNDFFERDYMYINQQNGTFKDELTRRIQHTSHSSMGADMADINNDGLPDIFTTEMLPDDDYRLKTTSSFENIDVNRQKIKAGFYYQYMQNTLQINNGTGQFLETAYYSGVAASDWSWGGLIFDANNDRQPDIFVCNGIYKDVTDQDFIDFFADELYQKMAISGEKFAVDEIISKMPSVPIPNKMFVNNGKLQFTNMAACWGLAAPSFSNGASYGDLDNDGDLDMIVNNVNAPCFVYQNQSRSVNGNHYLSLSLKGKGLNSFAIGSKVKLYTNNEIITRELLPTRGFQSSVDYKIIAGLGSIGKIDSLLIIWPDRTYTVVQHPPIDTLLHFVQPDKNPLYCFPSKYGKTFFTSVPTSFEKHTEDDYVDFYNERNIPAMLSREGPRAAVGDVNSDGLDDVFICGASGLPGQLYLQGTNGTFVKRRTVTFEVDAAAEGTCTLFFDADKDGDLDLIVGQGGNNRPANSIQYQCQLYFNDGKGGFLSAVNKLPVGGNNSSCIAANDFDKDGDIDLFIGCRGIPGNYGVTGTSMLLLNDGRGNFTNVAATILPELLQAGLITGAVWCGLGNKKSSDLVITGEWMAIRIFHFDGHTFKEQKTNLGQLNGQWQTVSASDLDNDGDDDLILGNIGKNFYLQPSLETTVNLWINDFDENGTIDKIITSTVNKKDLPIFTKKELTDQLPSLKKQNFKHADYARKSLQELFPANIGKAAIKKFNYAASSIAINKGNGNFDVIELPWQVQLSCVNKILPVDLDSDGDQDLLIGSNKYDFLPQFCRLDAAFGTVLINDGKGHFTFVNNAASGINVQGCVRDIQLIKIAGTVNYLWLRNDDFPMLYRNNVIDNNAH